MAGEKKKNVNKWAVKRANALDRFIDEPNKDNWDMFLGVFEKLVIPGTLANEIRWNALGCLALALSNNGGVAIANLNKSFVAYAKKKIKILLSEFEDEGDYNNCREFLDNLVECFLGSPCPKILSSIEGKIPSAVSLARSGKGERVGRWLQDCRLFLEGHEKVRNERVRAERDLRMDYQSLFLKNTLDNSVHEEYNNSVEGEDEEVEDEEDC